jgi:hypothetical protein
MSRTFAVAVVMVCLGVIALGALANALLPAMARG